jgi:hypothetical protein
MRAELLGVLDHRDVCVVSRALAYFRVLGDVATRERLEPADMPAPMPVERTTMPRTIPRYRVTT